MGKINSLSTDGHSSVLKADSTQLELVTRETSPKRFLRLGVFWALGSFRGLRMVFILLRFSCTDGAGTGFGVILYSPFPVFSVFCVCSGRGDLFCF